MNIIVKELKSHIPFTLLGAVTGIALMLIFSNVSHDISHKMFYVFHPMHVFLSALVTAAMYRNHKCPAERRCCHIIPLLFIGYVGSIGIATLSDSIIPFWGETLLSMPHRHVHAGFIEKWWLINPLALIGIAVAYYKPYTKFPHFGHVLLSTWASLFHVLMAKEGMMTPFTYAAVFIFLFLSVWLPCCISDIIFPLLFVKDKNSVVIDHH